jgi:dihydroflavonol-4-reductase
MKTLVTGGPGFIGSHLIERLRERGDEVVSLAKDATNADILRRLEVETIIGDLNNGIDPVALLDRVEIVYHLAGVTRARVTDDYYEGNLAATKRLIEHCLRHGRCVRRFVYVSSQAAAGPARNGRPVGEEDPCRPVSHYGRSKMLAERAVLAARDRLPVTIVRPSAVYGPRDRDFHKYFRLIKHHLELLAGGGGGRLNLIHARDLVEGLLLAAEREEAIGQTYFIASEEEYTTKSIAGAIARAMQTRPIRIPVPAAIVYAAGGMLELIGRLSGREVLLNLQKAREMLQPAWVCSVSKAGAELGFRSRVTLDDGIRDTLDWYREHRWL